MVVPIRGPCLWQKWICCDLGYFLGKTYWSLHIGYLLLLSLHPLPQGDIMLMLLQFDFLSRSNAAPVSSIRSNAPVGSGGAGTFDTASIPRASELWHSVCLAAVCLPKGKALTIEDSHHSHSSVINVAAPVEGFGC